MGPSEGYKGAILEVIPAEFSAALPPICTIVEASAKLLKDALKDPPDKVRKMLPGFIFVQYDK